MSRKAAGPAREQWRFRYGWPPIAMIAGLLLMASSVISIVTSPEAQAANVSVGTHLAPFGTIPQSSAPPTTPPTTPPPTAPVTSPPPTTAPTPEASSPSPPPSVPVTAPVVPAATTPAPARTVGLAPVPAGSVVPTAPQVQLVPTGGAQTGGGSTAGLQHSGLLVLGGLLLLASGVGSLLRRRLARDS